MRFIFIGISEREQSEIMGLKEFEKAIKLMYEKNYAESGDLLKETLKILKSNN